MLHTRHDLNLPSYPDEVGLRLDFTFLDRLYRHLLARLFVDSQLYFAVGALTQFFDYIEP